MIKKVITMILISLMLIEPCCAIGFEDITYYDDTYQLVDINDGINEIAIYETYEEAYEEFDNIKDQYDNLGITYKGLFLRVEYGIVTFDKSNACDVNVEFNNLKTGSNNYLNGCYGVDGVYIDTDLYQKVSFKVSGIEGSISLDSVTIIPLNFLHDKSLSTYIVKNGILYHQVKNDIDNNYYISLIELGEAPTYLENDIPYYSYDGHYFYFDMNTMIDDLHSGTNTSINFDNPYYNYYQFVSHRSLTNISVDELKEYYTNTLGIDDVLYSYQDNDFNSVDDSFTRSQFYGNEDSFYQYQYQYGANAAMMISLATNESALGRSSLAYTRNNLFGHAAYDSDVEKNASRYLNVNSSIYSHAKYYISGAYCYPLKYQYHGGFFGNKSSGMNVSYASDPYWGEKAAQFYYRLDKALGLKDLNAYTLGIISDYDVVDVYQYPQEDSNILYSSTGCKDFAFIILGSIDNEFGSWYKIQSDATLNSNSEVDLNYYYDYDNHVGYIKKDLIDVVVEGKGNVLPSVNVTFDACGGTFRDGSDKVSYKMNGSTASVETPVKDGSVFVGWDKPLTNITEDTVFTATYKEVDSIEMITIPKSSYELYERIDIKDGKIKVNYVDGSSEDVILNTSMISNYNMGIEGSQQVVVTYGGSSCTYGIDVSKQADDIYQDIKTRINALVESEIDVNNLTDEQINDIKELKYLINDNRLPRLSFNKLRVLDNIIYHAYGNSIEYGLSDKYNIQVSGLATSLIDDLESGWLKDYYKLSCKDGAKHEKILKQVAVGNEYDIHQIFSLHLSKRFDEVNFNGAMIVSIDKPEGYTESDVYTVFEYVDGEVRKCYTTQTDNKIQFITNSDNEYIVTSKDSANHYQHADIIEVINQDNVKIDIFAVIGVVVFSMFMVVLCGVVYIRFKYVLRKKKNDTEENSVEENQISE